ncbi:MAG: hypothetical protein ABJC19_12570 [Gemmatimonadota bacterium]
MPRTSALLSLAVIGTLSGAGTVSAQTTVRLSAGATLASPLVRDELGGAITLQAAVAPTISLAVTHPVGLGYRLVLEGQFASSSLEVTDNGVKDNLGALRSIGALLLLDGPIRGALRWQAGGGALAYRPARKLGVFADDSPTRWLLAAGANWSRTLTTDMNLVVGARYDFSTFTTKRLDRVGYSQFTTVNRVGLSAGVERRF